MAHLSSDVLSARQHEIDGSPADAGTLELLVARPEVGERSVLEVGELTEGRGLVGDNYLARANPGSQPAHPEAQLNMMNSRVVNLVADGDRDRWPLAGDQLYVDLDLSVSNLPVGTRLSIGTAVIEVSAKPHTGCGKFAQRFGVDAAKWVNSDPERRFRGINAMVVRSGTVAPGDTITKLAP